MTTSLLNFFECVIHHPAYKPQGKIFISYSREYTSLVKAIYIIFKQQNDQLDIVMLEIEHNSAEYITQELNCSDLYFLFYNSNYNETLGRPQIIQAILPLLKQHWQKSCVFKDYGQHFAQAFAVNPTQQHALNERLIKIASQSVCFTYKDSRGSHLVADIDGIKWQNISGIGNLDLVPGEIASYATINGTLNFVGTFLSVIPFAPLYGILDTTLSLTIKDSQITEIKTTNTKLEHDLRKYIAFNPSNSRIEELGIGTNQAVSELYGINAGFEERHLGLHLGLGGALAGSDHLDLLCRDGALYFDDTLIIQDAILMI